MIRLTTEKNEPDDSEYSINAIIDEFANLPKMLSVSKGVSYLRSYRIRVCVFTQNISKIKEIYGESRKEDLLSAPVKVAFNVTSRADAEYFSRLAGQKTVRIKNESMGRNMSMSYSSNKQSRPLLNAGDVMRLGRSKLLIYCAGHQVVKGRKNFLA